MSTSSDRAPHPRYAFVACLLFLSGMTSLVLQGTWMREFRLVFGASTPASAAVIAIFMGGLGAGSHFLGRVAERHSQPLRLYAQLLFLISAFAAVSPFLVDGLKSIYLGLGGQFVLGLAGATGARLLITVLVLGPPTFLMGGTFPAAIRAIASSTDHERRRVAVIYGLNTLGAVCGAGLSTFYLLETYGGRTTLWLACALDAVAAYWAWRTAARLSPSTDVARILGDVPRQPATARPIVVYVTSGIAGLAFLLMETVWFRMLAPLLGGSTFTFGVILMVALLGIGLGSFAYAALVVRHRPTVADAAVICALEALALAMPLMLGDSIAILANVLRDLTIFGFPGQITAWTVIAMIVVFPAAAVSGFQLPQLISMLGDADEDVGEQVGTAFACNTTGAILGSLFGGFGGLPLLGALGSWTLAIALIGATSIWLGLLAVRNGTRRLTLCATLGLLCLAVGCLQFPGPTAMWRHSGIGAGRFRSHPTTPNELRYVKNELCRRILYETDGVEASIALVKTDGLTFWTNGKADGNAVYEAGTQVMLGLFGGILHPEVKQALVVGLGTGETTGWLAEIPSIERVDVVELEPALDEMARRCSIANFDVLNHPKVTRIYNDAREVLLTIPGQYDLIVSEPSNPFRAGITNLYTQEFYHAGKKKLNDNGLFLQWIQAYEIDESALIAALATIRTVFPHVDLWQMTSGDFLIVAGNSKEPRSAAHLRQRIRQEPFAKALKTVYRVTDLEGLLSHFLAGPALVDQIISGAPINTDDRNRLEYGFARTMGVSTVEMGGLVRRAAENIHSDRPELSDPLTVDWERVQEGRGLIYLLIREPVPLELSLSTMQRKKMDALWAGIRGNSAAAVAAWDSMLNPPKSTAELSLMGLAYAQLGDARAESCLRALASEQPTEYELINAIYEFRRGNVDEAVTSLVAGLRLLRNDPWPFPVVVTSAVQQVGPEICKAAPEKVRDVAAAMTEPFALFILEDVRTRVLVNLCAQFGLKESVAACASFEPYALWNYPFLKQRADIYHHFQHPLESQAKSDLALFERMAVGTEMPARIGSKLGGAKTP